MKRRVVQIAAGTALLVVGAVIGVRWLGATSDEPIPERRSASASSSETREVDAHTPLAATVVDDGGARVAQDSTRTALEGDVDAVVSERLDELIRPVRLEDGVPLAEFRVAVITADGARRDLRPDEAVHASDLAAGGLWIVEAPRVCARWLAPREIERRREAGTGEPLALPLAAAASIVVHVEPTPAGRAPIEAIEVTAEGVDPEIRRSQLQALHGDEYVTPEQRNVAFAGLRELLVPTTPDARRRDVLAAFFAHRHLGSVVASASTTKEDALAPWCERRFDAPLAAATTITSVPAGARIELVVHCADVLEIDSHRRDDHVEHAVARRMRSAPIRLGAGDAAEVTITYAEVCSVRGRMPDDALTTADLRLFLRRPIETTRGPSYLRVPVPRPLFESERAFAWSKLPTGHYDFEARWNGPARDLNLLSRSFEVAAGEAFELGTLVPPSGATLTVVPRFVHADGSPFVSTLPPGRAIVACGDITPEPDDPRTWRPGGGFDVELAHGEPTVVRGLVPGNYRTRATGVVERADFAPPCSPPAGTRRHEFLFGRSEHVVASVRADALVEVLVPIGDVGSVAIELVLDTVVTRKDLFVTWSMVGGEAGDDREFGGNFTTRPGQNRTTIVEIAPSPTYGDWSGYFIVGVEHPERSNDWFTAQASFVVERGVDSVQRPSIEPAASLRIAKSRIAEVWDPVVLPDSERLGKVADPRSRREQGDLVILEGLFPRTEYLVLGSQRVTTGEPGSVVDVP